MTPGFICPSSDQYLNGLECWNQKKTSCVPIPQRRYSLVSFDVPSYLSWRMNSNPVRTAADVQVEGPYNLKKRLPRHVLSRHQSPQINLSTGTLE